MQKDGVAALCLFLKWTEYITSTFDIHDSIFDIRFFKVSFPIRLAVFLASGSARVSIYLDRIYRIIRIFLF
jgi:hypothetical protein